MKHLIVCTEYPPSPTPAGGIGTYAKNISEALAEAGEIVHVISVLFPGAPNSREELFGGKLVIHRVPLDKPVAGGWNAHRMTLASQELDGLQDAVSLSQCFAWQVCMLAEQLVEAEDIDIIETQEYNGPLYYFQLRRALGLGPTRMPPCLVHLHSPTEQIIRANEWDFSWPGFSSAMKMEEFSIRAADARLCPSAYLARQAEHRYSLSANSTTVIPLPTGDTPFIERNDETWQNGSICYVGRLEPRKGVIEWADAAVSVLADNPTAYFEFIGKDLPYAGDVSVLQYIRNRIPAHFSNNFAFHGEIPREYLKNFLMNARIAVVPSRWENFPNTCVEAMSTGLPVIASRNGGMAEMITDEISGWLASDDSEFGLEDALRRALETPFLDLATMGSKAATDIRTLCDNSTVVQRHLEFRAKIVETTSPRRHLVSSSGHSSESPSAIDHEPKLAIVIAVLDDPSLLSKTLKYAGSEMELAADVIVVIDETRSDAFSQASSDARKEGWKVLNLHAKNRAIAWNAGAEVALEDELLPLAIVCIDEYDSLLKGFLDACRSILKRDPDMGVLSCWVSDNGKVSTPLSPAFPTQLLFNEISTPLVVRVETFQELNGFCTTFPNGYEVWDLVNLSMAAGWATVVHAELLAERQPRARNRIAAGGQRIRRRLMERSDRLVAEYSLELCDFVKLQTSLGGMRSNQSDDGDADPFRRISRPRDVLKLPFGQQLRVIGAAFRRPRDTARFLKWHTTRAVVRAGRSLGMGRSE